MVIMMVTTAMICPAPLAAVQCLAQGAQRQQRRMQQASSWHTCSGTARVSVTGAVMSVKQRPRLVQVRLRLQVRAWLLTAMICNHL